MRMIVLVNFDGSSIIAQDRTERNEQVEGGTYEATFFQMLSFPQKKILTSNQIWLSLVENF